MFQFIHNAVTCVGAITIVWLLFNPLMAAGSWIKGHSDNWDLGSFNTGFRDVPAAYAPPPQRPRHAAFGDRAAAATGERYCVDSDGVEYPC